MIVVDCRCGSTYWDDVESVNAALSGCSTLKTIADAVARNPDVAAWVAQRPQTKF